jgi:hypothetical protein
LARFSTAPTPVMTPQAMRQADVSGTSALIGTAWISWTTVRSANDDVAAKFHAGSPLRVKGWAALPIVRRHCVGCPVLHHLHAPQLASVETTTWSPGFTRVTSAPTSSTTPAPSWPSTAGAGHGMVPSTTLRSLWHTPAAVMRTMTSRAPGARTSRSLTTSVPLPV